MNDRSVSSYRYQADNEYFAQIAHPIEELGAEELKSLGARKVSPVYRGIRFTASTEQLYSVVYGSRLCNRIIAPLLRFDCHSDRYLYRTVQQIDWSDFLNPDSTFAVTATVTQSKITHSHYAELRVKDAIVDWFRTKTGKRPSIDRRHPDLWISLHIANNKASLGIDVAGGSLHRRGYRLRSVEAPLQETVGAAIIRMCAWQGDVPLIDPMCGSGTLLAEALMTVCRIPPGFLRKRFGFEQLPDFDVSMWKRVRSTKDGQICKPQVSELIRGFDIDPSAVDATKANLSRLPYGDQVIVKQRDFFKTEPISGACLIMNPPYGLRIGRSGDIGTFYSRIGDTLKQQCSGSTAYIYAGKRELLKSVGLRTSWKKPLVNGSLDGRLAKFDLY